MSDLLIRARRFDKSQKVQVSFRLFNPLNIFECTEAIVRLEHLPTINSTLSVRKSNTQRELSTFRKQSPPTLFSPRNVADGHVWKENTGRTAWHWLAPFVLLLRSMRNTAKKILIVDGNDNSRRSLRGLIKGLGHEVFEAATGREAIDRASSIHPDLIMMELWLPEMSGDEATKRLKSNISTRNIPVVINTGWTTACNVEERADRALNAGAAEILYKPFYLPMLRDVLRSYLLA